MRRNLLSGLDIFSISMVLFYILKKWIIHSCPKTVFVFDVDSQIGRFKCRSQMAQGTGRRAKGRNTALNSYLPLALYLELFATSAFFLVMKKKEIVNLR
jgi:hypothetical protein